MNFVLDRRTVFAWSFIALSIIASVGLVLGGRSYFLLYDSLVKLHFQVTKVSHDATSSPSPSLSIQLKGMNSVDYSGLSIVQVSVQVYFSAIPSNATLFQNSPLSQPIPVAQNILAAGTTTWTVKLLILSNNSTSISSFQNSHPGEMVLANTAYMILVNSLLQKLSSRSIEYDGQDNVTLT